MSGIQLALVAAVISGISIFVNTYAVSAFPNATLFTTLKNVTVGAGLVAVVLVSRRSDVRRLAIRQWAGLGMLGIVGGSVPFVLRGARPSGERRGRGLHPQDPVRVGGDGGPGVLAA